MDLHNLNPLRFSLALLAIVLAAVSGCEKQEPITSYQVDKPHVVFEANHVASAQPRGDQAPPPTGPPTDRMLAAYVPHNDQGWFFKLVGPIDAVSEQEQAFRDFLNSVKFDEGAKPAWKLPESWTSAPGSSMRFATILIEAEPKPLELSVIPLPMPGGATPDYELSNINRWRDQMALTPLSLSELKEQTEQVEINGLAATIVDITGHFQSSGMAAAPFAAAGGAPVAPIGSAASVPDAGSSAPLPLEFAAPESWTELPAGGFRKAAYRVADEDRQAEITVIDLPASSGELLPNVNRWRGQVGLGPISQAELEAATKKIEAGPLSADYFEFTSPASAEPPQTILAAILVQQDKAWFFKLTGDADLASREQGNFEAFVKSVRFDGQ